MDLSQSLDKTTIKVDPGATELKQQLRSQDILLLIIQKMIL
ncbi:hypothetical protein NWE59_05150 [Mycoplasmopsis felis]|nr:hypothetical protein [Mycoplasmopsis felis]UWV78281.1 hypothetical protein NWE59_05150 [Mycoplasmopsis felis]